MTAPAISSLLDRPDALPPAAARPARALVRPGAAALAALTLLALGAPGPPATSTPARVALILDAGPRSGQALARARVWAARAERRGGVSATVRLPRTAAEALTDVRYLAAQGYDTVVVAGPRARAAAARAAAGGRFPHTRFERRAAGAL
jgi:hypothetical protein